MNQFWHLKSWKIDMTREEAAGLLPIIKAFSEGKVIEQRCAESWVEVDGNCDFHFPANSYRIKPESKFRPFANAEECQTEMLKHNPFGWVKTKDKGIRLNISGLNQESAFTQVGHKYDEALNEFTFADDAPFGVKVEE